MVLANSKYCSLTPDAAKLKDFLRICIDNFRAIEELEEEVQEMERVGLPVSEDLRDYLQRLRLEMNRRRELCNIWILTCHDLTSIERRILRLRYLCAYTWDRVCMSMHMDRSAAYANYRRALNKVSMFLKEEDESKKEEVAHV